MDAEEEIRRFLTNSINTSHHRAKYNSQLSEEQLETLQRYAGYYSQKPSSRGGKTKPATIRNALGCIRELGLFLNVSYKPKSDEEIPAYREKIVLFTSQIKADSSRATKKVVIRTFYKWLYSSKTYPAVVDDERLKPERVKSTKKPSDLPTVEDIEKMLKACGCSRDRALIMIWLEMGCLFVITVRLL